MIGLRQKHVRHSKCIAECAINGARTFALSAPQVHRTVVTARLPNVVYDA